MAASWCAAGDCPPPEAITAAARAMAVWWESNADLVTSVGNETDMPLARVALEAAEPFMVAAERERYLTVLRAAATVTTNAYGTNPRHTRARDGGCRDDCIPCGIAALTDALKSFADLIGDSHG
jgi:hypothetical protein